MGALVQVLETKEKVVTNIDGHFTIKATTGQTLQASYLGMLTQKVKIGNHSLTIVLKNDSRQIDEVVVTGYQNIRNRVYTGAATSVKMDDIKLEGIADVSRMLEGLCQDCLSKTYQVPSVQPLVSTLEVVLRSLVTCNRYGLSMELYTKTSFI